MASMLNELKGLGQATAAMASKFILLDPILAAIVTELKSVSAAASAAKGAEGVSSPLLIALAGVAGGILVYFVTKMY